MCDQQMDILDPIQEDSEFPVNVDRDLTHEDLFESMDSAMEKLDTKMLSEDKQPQLKNAGPRVYDINDQVKVVTKWWKEI